MDAKCAREDNISLEHLLTEISTSVYNANNILKKIDNLLNGPSPERENPVPAQAGLYALACDIHDNIDDVVVRLTGLFRQLSKPEVVATNSYTEDYARAGGPSKGYIDVRS